MYCGERYGGEVKCTHCRLAALTKTKQKLTPKPKTGFSLYCGDSSGGEERGAHCGIAVARHEFAKVNYLVHLLPEATVERTFENSRCKGLILKSPFHNGFM